MRYSSFLTDSGRWEGFELRADDIIISTPAKSGTTWTQMICALLIFQTPEFGRPLDAISPWLEMRLRRRAEVHELYRAQPHRRFIKSHTPLGGLPSAAGVTYICVGRDPRDVAVSWRAHMANIDFTAALAALAAAVEPGDAVAQGDTPGPPGGPPPLPDDEADEREAFLRWIDDPAPPEEVPMSLASTIHHLAGFWAARHRGDVVLLHYDDLQADLDGEMRRLAGRLGIAVPEERWPGLVAAARFEEMRRRADHVAPDTENRIWKSNRGFFHRGTSGQWHDVFDAEVEARYRSRLRDLAPDDLAAWLHRGNL